MTTHYVPFFTAPRAKLRTAVCGVVVFMGAHSVQPTCAACKAWLEADDAEAAALDKKWTAESKPAR